MYVCMRVCVFGQVAGLVHLGQVQFNKVVDYSGDVSEIKVCFNSYLYIDIQVYQRYVCMYVCMYMWVGFENN